MTSAHAPGRATLVLTDRASVGCVPAPTAPPRNETRAPRASTLPRPNPPAERRLTPITARNGTNQSNRPKVPLILAGRNHRRPTLVRARANRPTPVQVARLTRNQ